MLPGAAGFSGAHKKGLEEPGLVSSAQLVLVPLRGCNEAGSGSLEVGRNQMLLSGNSKP